jgi:uncharacterized protein (TIRG00374 family)
VRLKKSHLLLLTISITLTIAVPLVVGGLGQFKLLSRLSWSSATALLFLIFVSWASNALRLRLLLGTTGRRLGFWEGTMITISAEFAGNTTPGAVGLPLTYAFLLHKLKLSFGGSMGMVSLIILADVIFYGTLMPLAAVFLFIEKTPHTSRMVVMVAFAVIGGSFILWVLIRYYRPVCLHVCRQMGRVRWFASRRYRLARTTVDYLRALRVLRGMPWSRRVGLYLVTLGYWVPRYMLLVVVIAAVGETTVPFTYLFLMQGLLNLGGQLIILPGGAGGVDMAYFVLMSPYLSPQTIGLTLILWRVYTYYLCLVVGAPIFLLKTGEAARDLLSKRRSEKPAFVHPGDQ